MAYAVSDDPRVFLVLGSSPLAPLSVLLRFRLLAAMAGQQLLPGDIELGVVITYNPVDPSAPRPPLILDLAVTDPVSDGQTLNFTSDSSLTERFKH